MKNSTEIITKCAYFAALKHRNQRRLDYNRTPFINHPLGVAYILTNEAKIEDLNVIQGAILHDTVEDTYTTFEEIEKEFGKEVRHFVEEVTDDMKLGSSERRRLQIERAPNLSLGAKLIKLADRLDNLRDVEIELPITWTKRQGEEYYKWSKMLLDVLRGTNENMEKSLDDIFKKRGIT